LPKSSPIVGGAPISAQKPTLKPVRSPISVSDIPGETILPKPIHTTITPILESEDEESSDGEFKVPELISEELEEISEEDEIEIAKVLEETLEDADQIIDMLSNEIEEREQVIEEVIKKANVGSLKKLETPTLKPSSAMLKPVESSVLKPKTTTLKPSKAAVLKPTGTVMKPANNVLIPENNITASDTISLTEIAKEEIAKQTLEEE
jgi:hypothetical protein